jgi:hypothetical protein
MTLYRPVEVAPGVELRPAASGRAAELVAHRSYAEARRHGQDELVDRYALDQRALEDLEAAAREALE